MLVERTDRVFERSVALGRKPHFLRERIGLAEVAPRIGPVEIPCRRAEQSQHQVLEPGEIQRSARLPHRVRRRVKQPHIAQIVARGEVVADILRILPRLAQHVLVARRIDVRVARPIDRPPIAGPIGILMDERQQHVQRLRRLRIHQHASAVVAQVVHLTLPRRDVVDIPAGKPVVTHHAHRELVRHDREVRLQVQRVVRPAILRAAARQVDRRAIPLHVGLVRQYAYPAAQRSRPEQRPLRPAQHLHTLYVEQRQVHRTALHRRALRRYVVQIQPHGRLLRTLVRAGSRAHPAQRRVLLRHALIVQVQPGCQLRDPAQIIRPALLELALAHRSDADRHTLQPLRPPRRRHDHVLDRPPRRRRLRRSGTGRARCCGRDRLRRRHRALLAKSRLREAQHGHRSHKPRCPHARPLSLRYTIHAIVAW